MKNQTCLKFNVCASAAYENGLKYLPCDRCQHFIPRPGSKEAEKYKKGAKMSNQLSDLNNILFAQLNRLNNNELTGDAINVEITRSKAICGISTEIIKNADLALKAHTVLNSGVKRTAPHMLGVSDE